MLKDTDGDKNLIIANELNWTHVVSCFNVCKARTKKTYLLGTILSSVQYSVLKLKLCIRRLDLLALYICYLCLLHAVGTH